MSNYHSYTACSVVEIVGKYLTSEDDLKPLYGLAHQMYRPPVAGDPVCSIGFTATQYRGNKPINGGYGQYMGPKAFGFWSDTMGSWGPKFAAQLKKYQFGEVAFSGAVTNPCTGRTVGAWIWTIDAPRLKEWYLREFAKVGDPATLKTNLTPPEVTQPAACNFGV